MHVCVRLWTVENRNYSSSRLPWCFLGAFWRMSAYALCIGLYAERNSCTGKMCVCVCVCARARARAHSHLLAPFTSLQAAVSHHNLRSTTWLSPPLPSTQTCPPPPHRGRRNPHHSRRKLVTKLLLSDTRSAPFDVCEP